jgi:ABC-2 type transport system permease protein
VSLVGDSAVTGTARLVRQALRRDRVLLTVWTVLLVGVCYASAAAVESLYPTLHDRVSAAEAINGSPAIVALYGPILDVTSLGELCMTKLTVLYAVIVAVLFVVVVRRHTRVEEESGRTELLAGTAVGRHAPLLAAVTTGALVAVVIGLLSGLGAAAGGLPLTGSLAFGASWTGIGLVATGLTAVACQLAASARTCAAIAAGGIGMLYTLRAVGDTSADWLSWTTPFGWSTRLRAWSGTRWWVLLLYLALAAVLVAAAFVLRNRRDLGSGLVAARPGPATGSPRLADAVALAFRVHTATLAVWSAAAAVMAVTFGAIAPNIGDLLDSPRAREMMQRLGGVGVIQETLLAAEISIIAVVLTCFGITVVSHGSADEHDGRTEQVLATATSRTRSLVATAVVALGGTVWLLLLTGVGVSLGYGGVDGDLVGSFADLVPAALAQAPAVCLVVALAALAWAWRSTWTYAGWALLAGFLTVGQLGELLRLPGWMIDLSPYTHVPAMPVDPFRPAPTLVMTGLGLVVLLLTWRRYTVRDIG